MLLRREWAAAAAFAGLFGILSILGNDSHPVINGFLALAYFGSGAFTLLRSGLLLYAVAVFLSELLLKLTATLDTSAWYFGNMLTLLAIAVGLATWGLYTAMPRAPFRRPAA